MLHSIGVSHTHLSECCFSNYTPTDHLTSHEQKLGFTPKWGISGLFSIHKGKRSEGGILNLKFMFLNFSYAFGPVGKCNKI